jgi:hypothetical protein
MSSYSNFIGQNPEPVDLNNNILNKRLHSDRITAASIPQTTESAGISYGDYLTAADTFRTKNNHHNLLY